MTSIVEALGERLTRTISRRTTLETAAKAAFAAVAGVAAGGLIGSRTAYRLHLFAIHVQLRLQSTQRCLLRQLQRRELRLWLLVRLRALAGDGLLVHADMLQLQLQLPRLLQVL